METPRPVTVTPVGGIPVAKLDTRLSHMGPSVLQNASCMGSLPYVCCRSSAPHADSAGEIAAELPVPYPPGVSIVAPGEVITEAKVAYLRDGLSRGGTSAAQVTGRWQLSGSSRHGRVQPAG